MTRLDCVPQQWVVLEQHLPIPSWSSPSAWSWWCWTKQTRTPGGSEHPGPTACGQPGPTPGLCSQEQPLLYPGSCPGAKPSPLGGSTVSTPVAQPEGQLRKCRITEKVPNPAHNQCPKERKRYPALVSLSNTAVYCLLTHINTTCLFL